MAVDRVPRAGVARLLALCLVVVVGGFAGIVRAISTSASRELDAVSAHLRAVAVAEIACADVAARLAATPWSARWFRDRVDVSDGRAAAGGTYAYVLRDVRAPVAATDPLHRRGLASPDQAELLVRATFERASAVLYWRLAAPRAALDARRVVPVYFAFAPDSARALTAEIDAIGEVAAGGIRAREANRARFDAARAPLARAPDGTAAAAPALPQANRKAIVRVLREIQESMEVVSPAPGRTLASALVRDRLSRASWLHAVPRVVGGRTRYELWRDAERILSDVTRLAFTAHGEGALEIDLAVAEPGGEYALRTTLRLRNIASAEELW